MRHSESSHQLRKAARAGRPGHLDRPRLGRKPPRIFPSLTPTRALSDYYVRDRFRTNHLACIDTGCASVSVVTQKSLHSCWNAAKQRLHLQSRSSICSAHDSLSDGDGDILVNRQYCSHGQETLWFHHASRHVSRLQTERLCKPPRSIVTLWSTKCLQDSSRAVQLELTTLGCYSRRQVPPQKAV